MPKSINGQPFDIIAAKKGIVYAYDCKTNKGKRFRLDRIEDNQELAFGKFNGCYTTPNGFCVTINFKEVYFMYVTKARITKKWVKR